MSLRSVTFLSEVNSSLGTSLPGASWTRAVSGPVLMRCDAHSSPTTSGRRGCGLSGRGPRGARLRAGPQQRLGPEQQACDLDRSAVSFLVNEGGLCYAFVT